MPNNPPTSYEELIEILEALPRLCLETRRRKGQSLREAAADIGVPFSNLSRLENGMDANLRVTVLPILRWVAT